MRYVILCKMANGNKRLLPSFNNTTGRLNSEPETFSSVEDAVSVANQLYMREGSYTVEPYGQTIVGSA